MHGQNIPTKFLLMQTAHPFHVIFTKNETLLVTIGCARNRTRVDRGEKYESCFCVGYLYIGLSGGKRSDQQLHRNAHREQYAGSVSGKPVGTLAAGVFGSERQRVVGFG
jgi:hypothetical protein